MFTWLRQPVWLLTLFAVFLKFWLVAAQPVVAHANASFDDRLFLALAEQIVKGHWLGSYSQFTLMKGPMYSIFVAAAYIVRIPLPIAQHCAYLCGCALLVLALRPCFRAAWQTAVLFNLLWWQPMSYAELDILRQNIYTPLTLLFFAGLIALHTRQHSPIYARLLWGALLGVSAGAFYLTREEGIWIVPAAALLIACALLSAWRMQGAFLRTLAQIFVAAVIGLAMVSAICALNYRHYGWFGTVEFRAREFRSAYGALQRPIASAEIPYVPVTREVRLRLYEVSPAFAELRPCLEGPVGEEWANYSDYLTGRPGKELEIGGGSFMWALRDCIASSNHAGSAREALASYRAIGDQINRACDEGRAGPCRSKRDTLLPRFKSGQIRRLLEILPAYTADFVLFRGFTAYPTESWGSADLLELFREFTRWRLAPSNEAPELNSPISSIDRFRLNVLEMVGQTFRWLCVAVVLIGIVAWTWTGYSLLRNKRVDFLFSVSTAALGSAVAVLTINMLVHALAFRNQGPTALHEGYPLLVLFGLTALFALLRQSNSAAADDTTSA
jgi:hypothetical protein